MDGDQGLEVAVKGNGGINSSPPAMAADCLVLWAEEMAWLRSNEQRICFLCDGKLFIVVTKRQDVFMRDPSVGAAAPGTGIFILYQSNSLHLRAIGSKFTICCVWVSSHFILMMMILWPVFLSLCFECVNEGPLELSAFRKNDISLILLLRVKALNVEQTDLML